MRLSEYIVGYLSTLLVCKAVQWLIGDWSPRWSLCYISCLNKWSRYITFSYITYLHTYQRQMWYTVVLNVTQVDLFSDSVPSSKQTI